MIIQALTAKLVQAGVISEEDGKSMTSIVNIEKLLESNIENIFTKTEIQYIRLVREKLYAGDLNGARMIMPPPTLNKLSEAVIDVEGIIKFIHSNNG